MYLGIIVALAIALFTTVAAMTRPETRPKIVRMFLVLVSPVGKVAFLLCRVFTMCRTNKPSTEQSRNTEQQEDIPTVALSSFASVSSNPQVQR